MSEHEHDRYLFETFEADNSAFDSEFSQFLNRKYASGWKYKNCQFDSGANRRWAYCLFKGKS